MKQFSLLTIFLLVILASFGQKSLPEGNLRQEKAVIKFFPNPATSTITFELNSVSEKGTVLRVYSFLGRQVISQPVTGSRISLNITDLIKGIYVFQVRDASGRIIATSKFQVSR